MAIKKTTADGRRQLRIGMLGCGFMGKCHSNGYRTIPYIYNEAGFVPRLAVLCDQNEEIVEPEELTEEEKEAQRKEEEDR